MKEYFLRSAPTFAIFLITSFFIGFLLTEQWRSEVPKQSLYPTDQLESQKQLLQTFIDEQQNLEKDITGLRREIEMEQEKLPSLKQNSDSGQQETAQRLSLPEMKGDGVEVFLGDSPFLNRDKADLEEEGFIHAADLRDVINLLFSAGADGIAINDHRILPLHSINVVGNTFLVNDSYLFPPFTITGIGPQDVLMSRLKDETFLPDLRRRSREKRLRFSYQMRQMIMLPSYKGSLRADYLSEVP